LRGATVLVHLAGSAHFSQRRRSDVDLLQHDDVVLAHRVTAHFHRTVKPFQQTPMDS
jgi:hypothetical protein